MIGSNTNELEQGEKADIVGALPFYIVNLLGIAGFYYVCTDWRIFVMAASLYYIRMFFVTGFQHRYFSHRSFVIQGGEFVKRSVQFVMAFCVTSSAQKGPLWWAAWHRHHHKHSDEPEDVHSKKLRGFYWSHVGWILCRKFHSSDYQNMKDLTKYPELMILENVVGYNMAPVLLGLACYLYGGFPYLMGFFASTTALYHGTFCINSLAHMWGKQRFVTGDESRNCFWLNLLTLGEGWHNNHHHQEHYTAQAITKWEFVSDITYWILKFFEVIGVFQLRERKPV